MEVGHNLCTFYSLFHLLNNKSRLGVWDQNVLKLDCADGCTTINKIKFIEKTKKNDKIKPEFHILQLFPLKIMKYQSQINSQVNSCQHLCFLWDAYIFFNSHPHSSR